MDAPKGPEKADLPENFVHLKESDQARMAYRLLRDIFNRSYATGDSEEDRPYKSRPNRDTYRHVVEGKFSAIEADSFTEMAIAMRKFVDSFFAMPGVSVDSGDVRMNDENREKFANVLSKMSDLVEQGARNPLALHVALLAIQKNRKYFIDDPKGASKEFNAVAESFRAGEGLDAILKALDKTDKRYSFGK